MEQQRALGFRLRVRLPSGLLRVMRLDIRHDNWRHQFEPMLASEHPFKQVFPCV
jgi:hypothetical protein